MRSCADPNRRSCSATISKRPEPGAACRKSHRAPVLVEDRREIRGQIDGERVRRLLPVPPSEKDPRRVAGPFSGEPGDRSGLAGGELGRAGTGGAPSDPPGGAHQRGGVAAGRSRPERVAESEGGRGGDPWLHRLIVYPRTDRCTPDLPCPARGLFSTGANAGLPWWFRRGAQVSGVAQSAEQAAVNR